MGVVARAWPLPAAAAAAWPVAALLLALRPHAAAAGAAVAGEGLAEWLRGLAFEVPAFRWGLMTISGGHCEGLRAHRLEATDLGGERTFAVAYRAEGLGLRCRLQALDDTLAVSFELEDSMAELHVAVEPRALQLGGRRLALPLGQVTISQCSVRARLQRLAFEGTSILTPGLELSRHNIRKMFEQDGPAIACKELQGRVAQKATEALGAVADSLLALLARAPSPAPAPEPAAPLVDWASYPPLQLARAVLAERGDVLARLGRHRSALVIPVQWDLGGPSSNVSLRIESLQLHGLPAPVPGGLLLRGEGSRVDLSLACKSVQLVARGAVSVELTGARPLRKDLALDLSLGNASLAVQALAMVSQPALEGLSVEQLQRPSCLAGCAGSAVPPDHSPLRLTDFALRAAPLLRVSAAGAMEAELAALGEATVAAALRGYLPDLQFLLHAGIGLAQPHLDSAVRSYLSGAPSCESDESQLGLGDLLAWALPWISCCITTCWILAAMIAARASAKASALHGELLPLDDSVCEDLQGCGAEPGSLSSHAAVPRAASGLLPPALLGTAALFAYADLGLGTVINTVITAGGRTVTIGPAFAFSLASCVRDAWGAGAYGIAALVGLLSGVWPFAKLGLLLFAWWAPPRRLSVEARGRLLDVLDALGKYSLIDSWLAIIALAAYRLGWHSKVEAASLAVESVPHGPFFAFVLAAVLSLALGHAASECHRWAVRAEGASGRLSLPFDGSPLAAATKPRPLGTTGLRRWLTAGLALTAGAVAAGACAGSWQMAMSGAVAELLLSPEDATRRFSLVSLGMGITSDNSAHLALSMVQFVFFVFTLVLPLAVVALLLFLCHAPLERPAREAVLHVCKVLDSWASFDVFALAVAVSHFEFGLVAEFLVYHDNLSIVCGWVRDHLHTECFHIECSLTSGFALLAAAGLLSHAVPKAALRLCEAAMDEEEEAVDLQFDAADIEAEAVPSPVN